MVQILNLFITMCRNYQIKEEITKADAVIYVVGYNHDDEGEYVSRRKATAGGDRKSLRLHENESKLLQETGDLCKNSVAVLIGGSAIIVGEWKDKVNGIIHAFYPGMEGGTAIAKVLFGDINPEGNYLLQLRRTKSLSRF